MTGLLLLTPSNSDYRLPYYALLPQADDHEAYLAYRQPEGGCLDRSKRDVELCYFDIAGYDITIGPPTPTEPVKFNGSLGNLSRAAGVPVPAAFLDEQPPETLRARIRLNAGKQTAECHLARWFFNGNPWAPLGNVITWEFTDSRANEVVLTLRRIDRQGEPPETLVLPRPESGRIELFIRHTLPEAEENYGDSFLMEARHFDYYYDMLGVAPAGWRPLPVLLRRELSQCPWPAGTGPVTRAPGAPTCLVAGGTPVP
jgi:hypothetical protein